MPIKQDLTHPADRRRVVFWAKHRGHEIVTDLSLPHDVLVISERADFNYFTKEFRGAPRIFDLIDAYLAPTSLSSDLLRGIGKTATGQITGPWRRFTKHIELLCSAIEGVICSTPEQRKLILEFNENVHPILDSHEEFPFVAPKEILSERNVVSLFWEGLPYTLPSLSILEKTLADFDNKFDVKLAVITDPRYPKYLGSFRSSDTRRLIEKSFPALSKRVSFTSWNLENVIRASSISDLGILPISTQTPMNDYKAENRLLIMWRLGLPVLASPTKSYGRVFASIGSSGLCETPTSWLEQISNFSKNQDSYWNQIRRGQEYLSEFHSQDILLNKWDRAIESVL